MPKFQLVKVGKRTIKLSNLDKVIFPEAGIVKAELIQYYLQMSSTILRHIKNRPLSLIRYPDGVDDKQFFQKDKPEWAPDWIGSVKLGKSREKNYMLATEEATLIWLANLASVELHITQDKAPKNEFPDFFMFDLDPAPGQSFDEIKDIAFSIKEHVEPHNYHVFVKTSGGKGLHLFVPIEPIYTYDEMFDSVKSLAEDFVRKNPSNCTLKISKEARKGKLLVDIYRNRGSQTIIAPYSVRGRSFGPVSMPILWTELEELDSPQAFHLRNTVDRIKFQGDAWEGFASYAVKLHTDTVRREKEIAELPKSKYFKTPAQLEEYRAKRNFEKTSEPAPALASTGGHSFVIHRHHASRLHYDLRLERDGTLLSWAVPRGLPHKPGIKRLAVETEPHPIEYLQFDGEIPKGEYGGGMMWIFARGRYDITKEKKKGFYFHISSPQLDGEYRIHETKKKEWLLERVDRDLIDLMDDPIPPMLASASKALPDDDENFFYEVKWDGIRAIIIVEEGQIKIRSRNQRDITKQFPELSNVSEAFRCSNGIFDGEIVCLEEDGRPHFKKVISRLHSSSEGRIDQNAKRNPAYCYLFDCLYLDGRWLLNDPIELRQDWLKDSIKKQNHYRFSQPIDDGQALYDAAANMNLEGIIAKRRKSKYQIGKRTSDWIKIKYRFEVDVQIVGYTKSQSEESRPFGALHIAENVDGELEYRGKVGTGFNARKMNQILEELKKIPESSPMFDIEFPTNEETTWIEPLLSCQIEYASITDNQTYREPVFIKMT